MIRGDVCGRWVQSADDKDHVRIPDVPSLSLDQIEVDGILIFHSSSMPRLAPQANQRRCAALLPHIPGGSAGVEAPRTAGLGMTLLGPLRSWRFHRCETPHA